MQGSCSVEELEPPDLLDAVRTVSPGHETGITHEPIGVGYERFLGFAIQDILQAREAPSPEDRERHATNALMNARRCLLCLTDQYLQRDAFSYVKDAPREGDEKAEFLITRRIFDPLASSALNSAVQVRHRIEHGYEIIPFSEAESVVQTIRATVASVIRSEDPYRGP